MAKFVERQARRRHRCERQEYFDRLSPEARLWWGASECPAGGWIEPGTKYAESEGPDPFHPTRSHIDCLDRISTRVLA